jgi:hypothetical protein
MSSFNRSYAFVETAQGLGILSKTGKYLVEPKPHSIQQSVLNLMPLMDSLSEFNYYIENYFFVQPFDSTYLYHNELSEFKKAFNKLSIKNQLLINNLLLEYVAPNFFLPPNRITYDRNSLPMYAVSTANDGHKTELRRLYNSILTTVPHIEDVVMVPKYINFSMRERDLILFGVRRNLGNIRKSLNFKQVNDYWTKITLDNLLNINDQNNALFLKLFTQKLSALKDTYWDCSNPLKYIELIKENFYVLEEGIQFRLFSQPYYHEEPPILISFSWAELKPFLN